MVRSRGTTRISSVVPHRRKDVNKNKYLVLNVNES